MSRCLTICENRKLAKLSRDEIIQVSDDEVSDSSNHMDDSDSNNDLTVDNGISKSDNEDIDSLINTQDSNTTKSDEDTSQGSANEQSTCGEAVFSLECLHHSTPTTPETVEMSDSDDELNVENSQVQVSVKTEPVEEPVVLDLADVPDLTIQPIQENIINNPGLFLLIPDYTIPNKTATETFTSRFPSSSSSPDQYYSCHFDGKHNFMIGVSCPQIFKRTEPLMYCQKQNKLYITKDQPFKITVKADNVPSGSFLKVFAIYSQLENSTRFPVRRCPTHESLDFANGVKWYQHLVVSLSESAVYQEDNRVLSVSVPYENPQSGEEYTFYSFKLTCFSSCNGGISRRPLSLVFSLEKDGNILGKQSVNTKVCASPCRDYNADMHKSIRKNSKLDVPSLNIRGFSGITATKPDKFQYQIKVKDRNLYKFLNDLKSLYEAGALVQHLTNTDAQEVLSP